MPPAAIASRVVVAMASDAGVAGRAVVLAGTARPGRAGGTWAPARTRPRWRRSAPPARPSPSPAGPETARRGRGRASVPTGTRSPGIVVRRAMAASQRVGLALHLAAPVAPGLVDGVEHAAEAGRAVGIAGREVRPAEERTAVGGEEHRHRPPAATGHGLDRLHVDGVDVGSLLPVDLDGHEAGVEHRRPSRRPRTTRGPSRDTSGTPSTRPTASTGRSSAAGPGEGLVAPRVPVDRVVGVLAEVGAGLRGQSVHAGEPDGSGASGGPSDRAMRPAPARGRRPMPGARRVTAPWTCGSTARWHWSPGDHAGSAGPSPPGSPKPVPTSCSSSRKADALADAAAADGRPRRRGGVARGQRRRPRRRRGSASTPPSSGSDRSTSSSTTPPPTPTSGRWSTSTGRAAEKTVQVNQEAVLVWTQCAWRASMAVAVVARVINMSSVGGSVGRARDRLVQRDQGRRRPPHPPARRRARSRRSGSTPWHRVW